jgi:hypothetical protein
VTESTAGLYASEQAWAHAAGGRLGRRPTRAAEVAVTEAALICAVAFYGTAMMYFSILWPELSPPIYPVLWAIGQEDVMTPKQKQIMLGFATTCFMCSGAPSGPTSSRRNGTPIDSDLNGTQQPIFNGSVPAAGRRLTSS